MNFDTLAIRLLEPIDLKNYFSMIQKNRTKLERFFAGTIAQTGDLEQTKNFLAWMKKGIQDKTYFPYVIIEEDSGSFIGFMDLKNIDWRVPKAEIGYYIDLDYAGKESCLGP